MPLTRHLYREDEVTAALMLSVLWGRTGTCLFWALEMMDSGLVEEMIVCMRRIWLLGLARAAPWWLAAWEAATGGEELDADAVMGLVYCLCCKGGPSSRCDATVAALLSSRLKSSTDIVHQAQMESGASGAEGLWKGLRASLPPEKRWDTLAAICSSKHGDDAMRSLLPPLQTLEGAGTGAAALAAAVAIVALDPTEFKKRWKGMEAVKPTLPPNVQADLERWRALTGRRARREIAIPIDCLYWLTERGRSLTVYETNEREIMGLLEKPTALWNSTYWDDVATELGGWEAVRNGDEAREAFYAEQFPDDIPDEWSAADRAKSHGRGVLQPGKGLSGTVWLQRWFGLALPAAAGTSTAWNPANLEDLFSEE